MPIVKMDIYGTKMEENKSAMTIIPITMIAVFVIAVKQNVEMHIYGTLMEVKSNVMMEMKT